MQIKRLKQLEIGELVFQLVGLLMEETLWVQWQEKHQIKIDNLIGWMQKIY